MHYSFNHLHCDSVIAFTILLLLNLSFISTVPVEYCSHWCWTDEIGKDWITPEISRGDEQLHSYNLRGICSRVLLVWCSCCMVHFIYFNSEIALEHFRRSDGFITFHLFFKATVEWPFFSHLFIFSPRYLLTQVLRQIIRPSWVLNKQSWVRNAEDHYTPKFPTRNRFNSNHSKPNSGHYIYDCFCWQGLILTKLRNSVQKGQYLF